MTYSHGAGYPRSDLLVDTAWLADHLNAPSIRIVDCHYTHAYERVHIPGAVHIGDNYLKDPDTNRLLVMKPGQLAELLGNLGISNDTLVVGYDARGGVYAARLWWALNLYGHTKVKVLNGGWRKWFHEGRPVTDEVPTYSKAKFTPGRLRREQLATVDDVKAALAKPFHLFWDVRSREEYTGENTRGNKRPGHIKGARQLEWVNNVNTDGTFKSAAELKETLTTLGMTDDNTVTTY